jgi:hypothetical protein
VLRKERPETKIILSEPSIAQLLGSGVAQERGADHSPAGSHSAFTPHPIQGWTPDFIPYVLQESVDKHYYDELIPIAGPDAIAWSAPARREEGIFTGISGGASLAARCQVAERAPKDSVLCCMLPDTGERYLSTPLFEGVATDMTPEEERCRRRRRLPDAGGVTAIGVAARDVERDPRLHPRPERRDRALLPSRSSASSLRGDAIPRARGRSGLRALDNPLPDAGVGRDAVLAELADLVVANGLRTGHPASRAGSRRCRPTSAPPPTWRRPWRCRSGGGRPRGNFVDDLAMRWLISLLGFPAGCRGTFSAGGSTAQPDRPRRARGSTPASGSGSIPRATATAGWSSRASTARRRPTTSSAARSASSAWAGAACARSRSTATARSTSTGCRPRSTKTLAPAARRSPSSPAAATCNLGRVDPIAALARIAGERGIWLHVDGAYGGWGVLDDRVRERFGDVATLRLVRHRSPQVARRAGRAPGR